MPNHRRSQAPLLIEPVIGFRRQIRYRILREEIGSDALLCSSSDKALAPFSQNSKVFRFLSGLGQAQLWQSNPVTWLIFKKPSDDRTGPISPMPWAGIHNRRDTGGFFRGTPNPDLTSIRWVLRLQRSRVVRIQLRFVHRRLCRPRSSGAGPNWRDSAHPGTARRLGLRPICPAVFMAFSLCTRDRQMDRANIEPARITQLNRWPLVARAFSHPDAPRPLGGTYASMPRQAFLSHYSA